MNDNQAQCMAYLCEHSQNWVGLVEGRSRRYVLGLPDKMPLSYEEVGEMIARGWISPHYYAHLGRDNAFLKPTDKGRRVLAERVER